MKLEIQDQDILKALNLLGIKNKRIRKIIAGIEEFFLRVERHHLYLISAGIAFNILLYLIPLLLIAIYLVDIIFGVESVTGFLTQSLEGVLPPNETTSTYLHTVIKEVSEILSNSSTAGIVGLLSLLWLSSTLLSSMRVGINAIFHIASPKIYFFYKIKDIILIMILTLFILLASFIFPVAAIASSGLQSMLPASIQFIFSRIYLTSISLVSSFIIFYFLYSYVPNRKMPRFIRLMSTIMCVSFLEIARYVFAWYISGVTSYGKFYGTYAILASVALWIFYLTLIILFSAEFSQLVYDLRHDEK